MKYIDLSKQDQQDIIQRVQAENGLNGQIIALPVQPDSSPIYFFL